MPAPAYTQLDYANAMQALMPSGRAWPRDASSNQSKMLYGLAKVYAVQNARANQVLQESFPATANELLPEWEATLGLPSAAAGPAPSIAARRVLVNARFIGAGGLTIANIVRYAALLGYAIQIAGKAPFRCGQSRCGHPLGGQEQMFGWTIRTMATSTVFGAYGPAVLYAELARIAPAFGVMSLKIQ